jgi:hypothetical protein
MDIRCRRLSDQAMPSASGVALNLRRRQVAPLGGRTANTQNPSLHLRDGFFLRRQVWLQEACKAAVPVRLGKPGGDGEGIMLIAGAVGAGVSKAKVIRLPWQRPGHAP